jgi:hypothetical protein
MAKDRNQRYASTADLLLDLEAIAAGESPLQARKRIDSNVLTGLAEGQKSADETTELLAQSGGGNLPAYLIVLLAASVILNVVLILMLSARP